MRNEIKITLIYLILGFLWILISDRVLLFIYGNNTLYQLSYFQTAKGLFYVASTGFMLFFLIRAYNITVEQKVKELERVNRELEAQSNKLRAANAEMEQFAFVASHDLQEPLRTITNFLTLLKNQYQEKLDANGQQYINFVVDATKRMRQIILDLLNYSLTGNQTDLVEDVSLKNTFEEVCKLQQLLINESHAVITIGDLPTVSANRTTMFQIFQNLLVNSLKYAREGITPRISLTALDVNDFWQISFSDNGIGIDKEYFDKIFIIFQRLHDRNQYSGTGMGLTIVKKIIENAGGRIRVESEPGSGSTFIFTIPKRLRYETHSHSSG